MIADTSSNALLRHPSASDFRGKPDIARTRTNSVTAKRWWASRFSSRGVWQVPWSHSLGFAAQPAEIYFGGSPEACEATHFQALSRRMKVSVNLKR